MTKKIQLLKKYPPHYRMIEDDVLEEVTVSLRQNPRDGKKYVTLANEYRRYSNRRNGKVVQVVFDKTTHKTELERIRVRKDQTVEDVISALDDVVQITLDEFEYGTEPPTWFAQHQWQEGIHRENG